MRSLARVVGLSTLLISAATGCGREPAPPPAASAASPASAPGPAPSTAAAPDPLVGHAAPDFTAKTQSGADVHLAALKGKPVVVYFYPKDETPGCTKEACSFRDAWTDLDKQGVVLIGISADTDASHRAFAEHHKLPFLLVSDPDGKIAGQFGVPFTAGYPQRQSFVIGRDGSVVNAYRKVDVTKHAKEISDNVAATAAKGP